ncbi:class D sortase [Candidatus Microgenomates bacterium]|nr:class D sortase [Candidatus Microgenomates bacterium]
MYIKKPPPKRGIFKLFSYFLIGVGILLIFYVVFPILSWQFFYAPGLSSGNIISPIPKTAMIKQSFGTVLAQSADNEVKNGDLTNASNWFPTGNPKTNVQKEYALSIPKLGIKDAKVLVGADDLSKSLIHYGGSSLPGEYGNAVIFGHSILPQFFDPKNYKAIFSTLHTLKIGDEIIITLDGVTYKYSIFEFKIVEPENISVLEQTYDNSYVTLITCTPPGTYWKRLVVKAQIEKL